MNLEQANSNEQAAIDARDIQIDQQKLLLFIKIFYLIYWIPRLGTWWHKRFMDRLVYRIEADCLVYESGVFFYTKKRVPFEAIREASIYCGPILQLFGASLVRIQTAGQNTGWPEITYLCPADPEALVEEIMQRVVKAKQRS